MNDTSRLERNLIAVARRYAPALIPAGWQQPGDYSGALPALAGALATYNVLVMAADAPQTSVKGWTDGYLDFYKLLSAALFPSFTRASAFYVDQQEPLIVAIYGEATPVITAMAGFVAPYVVARQGTRPLEVEIQGMMDMILEEVEATDLPREEYRRLRDSGASVLRGLLGSQVRQLPVTPPSRPIFDEMAAQQPAVKTETHARVAPQERLPPPQPDDLPEPPPPPATLPEELNAPSLPAAPPELPESEPPKRAFDPDAVPIFFNPGRTNLPKPPVPPLPPREKH